MRPLFRRIIFFEFATSDTGQRYPSECIILDSWVFDNFILASESFAKALQRLEICVSVNSNLCGKLAL